MTCITKTITAVSTHQYQR